MPVLTPADAREFVDVYRTRPVSFIRDILRGELWDTPIAIAKALREPQASVAVKGCNSSGKTWLAGRLAHWFLATGGSVVTTATSHVQVKSLLWKEIRAAAGRSIIPLGVPINQVDVKLIDGVEAIGISTNTVNRFQGWHGRVLFILDEAQGVEPFIYDALEGNRSGGDVRVLMQGNPTSTAGPFRRAFYEERALWKTFSIDAYDTPNLAGITPDMLRAMNADELAIVARPGLVDRRWVRQRLEVWGESDWRYQARVKAEFPTQSADSKYSLAWLEAAKKKPIDTANQEPIEAGVDVAGPGEDETAVYLRAGQDIVGFAAWPDADPRGHVVAMLGKVKARLKSVKVDEVGIGYNFMLHLQDQGFPVIGVNVGSAPSPGTLEDGKPYKEHYLNLKAEIYDGLAMRLKAGDLAGLIDEDTIAQGASIRYGENPRGLEFIESKDDARKRGVKSPDRWEALVLAFANVEESSPFKIWVA